MGHPAMWAKLISVWKASAGCEENRASTLKNDRLSELLFHSCGSVIKHKFSLSLSLQILTHAEFVGLDGDADAAHSTAVAAVAPPPKETLTYIYKVGVYGQCSASCNGGTQHRSVECRLEGRADPRAAEESHCVAQRLQRPHSQQACNMQPCVAEYSVSSFSVVCDIIQTYPKNGKRSET